MLTIEKGRNHGTVDLRGFQEALGNVVTERDRPSSSVAPGLSGGDTLLTKLVFSALQQGWPKHASGRFKEASTLRRGMWALERPLGNIASWGSYTNENPFRIDQQHLLTARDWCGPERWWREPAGRLGF